MLSERASNLVSASNGKTDFRGLSHLRSQGN